jgi:hypothetical protein
MTNGLPTPTGASEEHRRETAILKRGCKVPGTNHLERLMTPDSYFSNDYQAARRKFLAACEAAGVGVESY